MVLTSGLALATGATPASDAPPARPSQLLLAQQSQSPPAPSGAPQEALLLVDINKQGLNETVLFLRDASGRVYAAVQDLKRWRLPVPEVPSPKITVRAAVV